MPATTVLVKGLMMMMMITETMMTTTTTMMMMAINLHQCSEINKYGKKLQLIYLGSVLITILLF